MSPSSTAILVTLAAAFSGWLQSGSVVPMVLSLLVLLSSFTFSVFTGRASPSVRTAGRNFIPGILAGIALYLEIRLHQGGLVLDSLTLPAAFHAGIALLWWFASDLILRSNTVGRVMENHHALVGVSGGLLLVSASALSGGNLHPWLSYPIAALPLATCAARALIPSLSSFKTLVFAILPASLTLSGIILASGTAAEEIRHRFYAESETDSSTAPYQTSSDQGTQDGLDQASRRLPREADIRFTGKVMVYLRAHSPEVFKLWKKSPLYLRTSSLTLFESDEVISPIRSGRWIYDADDGMEDNKITLQRTEAPAGSFYTAYVSRESIGHLPILVNSPGIFTTAIYEFADDWYQLTPPSEVTHLQYRASVIAHAAPEETTYPELHVLRQQNAPSIYLNLPPTPLSSRIRSLASDLDSNDPLGSIRRFLNTTVSYSLQFSTPPESSPVEELLFGSRKGHCEHYAAATVLLLRSLGIPSRIAYGYAGGSSDSRQRIIAFRDSDFHAWAEILDPVQNDWILFDTTPNASGAAPGLPTPASLPAMDEAIYHNFSIMDSEEVFAPEDFAGRITTLIELLSRHFLLTSVLGFLLVAILARVLTKQRRRSATSLPVAPRPESILPLRPRFVDELEVSASRLGIQRKPGHTLKDLIAGISHFCLLPDGIDSAVSYYYSVSYCGQDPDPAAEKHYLNLIREWSQATRSD